MPSVAAPEAVAPSADDGAAAVGLGVAPVAGGVTAPAPGLRDPGGVRAARLGVAAAAGAAPLNAAPLADIGAVDAAEACVLVGALMAAADAVPAPPTTDPPPEADNLEGSADSGAVAMAGFPDAEVVLATGAERAGDVLLPDVAPPAGIA